MSSYPDIKIGLVANLFSRMMHFKHKGDVEVGHTHQFDHLTLLASGELKVTVDGVVSVFSAPSMIYIHKDKVHELVALADDTVAYCIHALRSDNESGDIIPPECIPSGVTVGELFSSGAAKGLLGDNDPTNSKALDALRGFSNIPVHILEE